MSTACFLNTTLTWTLSPGLSYVSTCQDGSFNPSDLSPRRFLSVLMAIFALHSPVHRCRHRMASVHTHSSWPPEYPRNEVLNSQSYSPRRSPAKPSEHHLNFDTRIVPFRLKGTPPSLPKAVIMGNCTTFSFQTWNNQRKIQSCTLTHLHSKGTPSIFELSIRRYFIPPQNHHLPVCLKKRVPFCVGYWCHCKRAKPGSSCDSNIQP